MPVYCAAHLQDGVDNGLENSVAGQINVTKTQMPAPCYICQEPAAYTIVYNPK